MSITTISRKIAIYGWALGRCSWVLDRINRINRIFCLLTGGNWANCNRLWRKKRSRQIYYLWRPFLKDPKDDLVLELAVQAGCHHIISFNKRDFFGAEKFGISVYAPWKFLKERGLL